jgi:uncharacterized protein YkwD
MPYFIHIKTFDLAENIININYVFAASILLLVGCGSGESSFTKTLSSASNPTAPSDTKAASSVRALDTSLQTLVPKASYDLGSQELAAFTYLNSRRAACGFGYLKQDTRLDAAALAHAKYIALPVEAAISHVEAQTVSPELFTGANPIDRALAKAYPATKSSFDEDFGAGYLSETNFAEVISADLMNAPFHLLSLLRSNRDVGIGVYSANRGANSLPYRAVVLNMSTTVGTQEPDGVQTYPCQGSSLAGGFYGGEVPDPYPGRNYALNPMGSPLAILSPTGTTLSLQSYSLRRSGDSQELALNVLSSSNRSTYIRSNEIVLMPELPMVAGASYDVKLAGTVDGVAWVKVFTFTITN